MRMKAGDLLPALVIDLTDNQIPVNLTSATAVHVIGRQGTAQLFDDGSPTRDNTNGVVTHNWVAPQTDTPGRIWVRVEVTWPSSKIQTFPPFGELAVDVEE
jgi:hypothetical protein